MVLTTYDDHVIWYLSFATSIFGAFGASMIIISYLWFKELRTFSSRIILCLSICDLGEAIVWFLSPRAQHDKAACVAQGMGIQYFGLAGIIWQICIATYVLQVAKGVSYHNWQLIIYNVLAWGIPALTLIIGGPIGIYGTAGPWCWILTKYQWTGIGMVYIPVVICLIGIAILYTYIDIVIRRKEKQAVTESEKIAFQKMKLRLRSRIYLFPFAMAWIFGLINRIHNAASPAKVPALFGLYAFTMPLQGFWNFLMYGFTERIRGPQSVADIIANPKHWSHFGNFLDRNHSKENWDFWLAVETLKPIPEGTVEWTAAAGEIIAVYLMPSSPKEVNILGPVKDKFEKGNDSKISLQDFIEAQQETVWLMQQNIINFQSSPEYATMLEEMQRNEALSGDLEGRRLIGAIYYTFQSFLHNHSCAVQYGRPAPPPRHSIMAKSTEMERAHLEISTGSTSSGVDQV